MTTSSLSDFSKEYPTPQLSPTVAQPETASGLSSFYSYFGFKECPFNNTPDPAYFYNGPKHQEGLMNLKFGVEQRRGFIVVTGEVGSGKTTMCRQFLQELSPEIKTAVILNPAISSTHLLSAITHDFGIKHKGRGKKEIYEALSQFLLDGMTQNQNACLIIDEAQCLSAKVLEEIRLLSNLETPKQKLIQIILIGQPELKDTLRKPSLRQLRQRVGIYVHLTGLNRDEMKDYIEHRMEKATGGNKTVYFHEEVLDILHEQTRGTPRLVNTVCDRILMSAYTKQTQEITTEVAQTAFDELSFICDEPKGKS